MRAPRTRQGPCAMQRAQRAKQGQARAPVSCCFRCPSTCDKRDTREGGPASEESGHSPLPSTADGAHVALRQYSSETGTGRAYRRVFAQAVREDRAALVPLPLLLQRDRLTFKLICFVARYVVQLSNSDLRTKARISSLFCSRFATAKNYVHISIYVNQSLTKKRQPSGLSKTTQSTST